MTAKITIADLFPHDEGMILVAKDAVDSSLRHISEVANGLAAYRSRASPKPFARPSSLERSRTVNPQTL